MPSLASVQPAPPASSGSFDDRARVVLEEALSVGLSSVYAADAMPAEPIRALAHQLLDYADHDRTRATQWRPSVPAAEDAGVLREDADETESWTVSKFIEVRGHRAPASPPDCRSCNR